MVSYVHYCTIKKSFTPLNKFPALCFIHHSSPRHIPGNLQSADSLHSLVFTRMSYKWNHILCNLFILACFSQQIFVLFYSLFFHYFLINEQYSIIGMFHNLFNPSPTEGHLGCFYFMQLGIKLIQTSEGSFCVAIHFQISWGNISECYHWMVRCLAFKEIAKLPSKVMVPLFYFPRQQSSWPADCIVSSGHFVDILVGVWWYVVVVFICNSLVTVDVEHLFIQLLPILFGEVPVQIFCTFLTWVVCFPVVEFQEYLLWIRVLCQIRVYKYYLPGCSFCFVLFFNSVIHRAEDLNFNPVYLFFFPHESCFWMLHLKLYQKPIATQMFSYIFVQKFCSFVTYISAYHPFQVNVCVRHEVPVSGHSFTSGHLMIIPYHKHHIQKRLFIRH